MSRPSVMEQRIERQSAELLAIVSTEPGISTAELAFRTGMSEGVVRKRLTYLRDMGTVTGGRGRAWPVEAAAFASLSLEDRVGRLERLLLKVLAQQAGGNSSW